MGMFSKIARVFGGQGKQAGPTSSNPPTVVVDWKNGKQTDPKATTGAHDAPSAGVSGAPAATKPARPTTATTATASSPMQPGQPVRIDLADDATKTAIEPKLSSGRRPESPKPELVRAEEVRESLRDELRDSYERAISLAEKVDQHLDTQEERSRRLLEIAENLPAALESIGAIGQGQDQLRSAVTDLSSAFREGQASTQQGLAMQLESLGRVEGLMAEANDSQREIRASIESLSSAFDEITASNKRLGDTLTDMKRRDAEREERLETANAKTHKLLMGVVIGGAVIGGLAVLALIAQTLVQAGVVGT
ncbi:MAG: hypothetical protein AAGB48_10030 [Planctomycetota bacterium]